MNAHRIQVVERARLQKALQKLPGKSRRRRPDNRRFRFSRPDRLAGRQGQPRVLLDVRFGGPELNVRFVPNFPENMASVEMMGGGSGPACESGDALGMLRRSRGLA